MWRNQTNKYNKYYIFPAIVNLNRIKLSLIKYFNTKEEEIITQSYLLLNISYILDYS